MGFGRSQLIKNVSKLGLISVLLLSVISNLLYAAEFGGGFGGNNPPAAPNSVTAPATNSSGSFTLTWGGLQAYEKQVEQSKNGGAYTGLGLVNAGVSSKSISGLTDGSYRYRVKNCTLKEFGNVKCSGWTYSGTMQVVKLPGTPSSLSVPSNDNNGSFSISWGSASGAVTRYETYESKNSGAYVSVYSGTAISKSLSGRADGSYKYRVRACNTAGCSGYRNGNATLTVRLIPSVPGLPNAPSNSAGNNSVNVTWSKPAGSVTHYDLQKRLGSGSWSTAASTITTTSRTVTGLADGTWTFRLRACNTSLSCSSYSGSDSTVVRLKPSTPVSANPTTTTDTNTVTVNWTATSRATYYNLQKRNNAGSWATAASSVSATSKALSGFTDGSWDFRVQACNGYSWACSSYGVDGSQVLFRVIPSIPAKPSAPSTSTSSAAISWSKPAGTVTYYDIQKRNNGGSWVTGLNGRTTTSATVSTGADGSWDFRVRACNGYSWACSNFGIDSSNTTVRKVASVPAAVNPTTSTDTNSVSVSWSAASSATYYNIQKRNNGGSWQNVSGTFTGTSASVGSLSDGSWDFRIKGCNGYSWACSSYGVDGSSVVWRGIPSTPALPIAPSTSTGSAAISWSKPAGTVTYYDLQKRLNNTGSWSTAKAGDTNTSETVSGLTNGLWDFRVRACNGYSWACTGYSSVSSDTNVRLKPSKPAAIANQNDTNGSFVLSWTKPSGTVTFYTLQERAGSGSWVTLLSSTTATSYTRTGRSNNTDYQYQVRACNTATWACSAYSTANTVKVRFKPSTPAAPSGVNSVSTSFTVNWAKPSGTVSYYQLQERIAGGSWSTIVSNTSALSKAITGKVNGTNYEYRVKACNGYSWSCSGFGSSNSVKVRLKPSTPAAPSRPSTSTGSAAISWAKPPGNVSYYDLQKRLNNTGSWQTGVTGLTGTSATLTGLTDGLWDFRFRACNQYSWACSAYSGASSDTTVRAKPSTPSSPIAPASSVSGSYTISWTKPSGAVSYYDLQERTNNTGSWVTVANNTGLTAKALSGRADNSYDYRVRACNTYDWACGSYSGVSGDVVVLLLPSVPASISVPSQNTNGSVPISWGTSSGQVVDYRLEEQKDAGAWTQVQSGSTATSKTLTSRSNGSYSYRVRACNASGCSGYRTGSNSLTLMLKPNVPSVSGATTSDDGQVSFSWAADSKASSYDIDRRVSGGSWARLVSGATATSYSKTETNGSYDYRVRGCNALSCSGFSGSQIVQVYLINSWGKGGLVNVADASLAATADPGQSTNYVGAVEGSGGVSGGAASYSVLIAIPPGRAGMQPSVSLNYSSRSGNGIVGMGWSLSAGSSVHRCGQTQAQDGRTKGVTYSATDDRFCLDGQRLMVINGGTYGTAGSEYRTELDSFAKIQQFGSLGAGYFKVTSKSGVVSTYGVANTTSRHIADGVTEVLVWAIDRTVDPSGNMVKYDYNYVADGEYVLDAIHYTGLNFTNGDRHVWFDYEQRPDFSTSYLAGGKTRKTQRLKAIRTEYNGTALRQYDLNYANTSTSTQRTLLRSVQETSNGKTLAPTTFEWLENTPKYDFEELEFDGAPVYTENRWLYQSVPREDTNGDGVKDWPEHDIDAEAKVTGTRTLKYANCYRPYNSFTLKCLQGDFNNDGLTDSFTKVNDELVITMAGSSSPHYTGIVWDEAPMLATNSSGNTSLQPVEDNLLDFADYNGDGFTDIVFYESDSLAPKLWIYLHNGSLTAPFSASNRVLAHTYLTYTSPYGPTMMKSMVEPYGDMDGNGTPDFIVTDPSGKFPGRPSPQYMLLTESDGNGGITFTQKSFTGGLNTVGIRADFFADFNSDGLTDWFAVDNNFMLNVKLNRGGGNFESAWQNLNFLLPMRYGSYELQGDVSSQARGAAGSFATATETTRTTINGISTDRITGTSKTSTGFYSLGQSFSTQPEIGAYFYPVMDKIIMLDYDGNGLMDFLKSSSIVASACSKIYGFSVTGSEIEEWKCDNELYGNFIQSRLVNSSGQISGVGQQTPIHSELIDDSVRGYTLISFTEDVNGNFNKNLDDNGTGIVTSANQHTVVDAYGNGLSDIVFTVGCRWGDCLFNEATSHPGAVKDSQYQPGTYIMRNRGAANQKGEYEPIDLMKKSTDGLGRINEWTYKPLTTGKVNSDGQKFYNVDHSATAGDPDYFHFASSMYAVFDHKTSNAIGTGLNTTEYGYEGAMYNTKGRGFSGFLAITKDDLASGFRTVTDFKQKFPYAGQLEEGKTCLIIDAGNDCSTAPLRRSWSSYDYKPTAQSNILWVFATQSDSANFELNDRNKKLFHQTIIVAKSDTDSYGNILKSTKTTDKGSSSLNVLGKTQIVTESTFYTQQDDWLNWWVNKLQKTTVTASTITGTGYVYDSSLDTLNKVETNYTWTSERQPDVITTNVIGGEGKSVTVDTDYNVYGLSTKVTTSSPGEVSRFGTTTYSNDGQTASPDGYFVYQSTNAKGHTTTTTTYPEHGQVKKVTDANGVWSTRYYDAFGRAEKVVALGVPDATIRYEVCTGCDGVVDAKYKITSYQVGSPQTIVYKDMFNRVLMSKTEGFLSTDFTYQRVDYDVLGRKTYESVPLDYLPIKDGLGTRYKNYDAIGRLTKKEVDNSGNGMTVLYTYMGFQTKIDAGVLPSMYRTLNGAGELIQTTDSSNGITRYAYDSMGNPIVLEDAKGVPIKIDYNTLGQKRYVDDPNMGRKDFSYTGYGEVETETDANGNVISSAYDILGRLSSRTVNGSTQASYTFDCTNALGLVCSESGNGQSKTLSYDNQSRPITSTVNITGEPAYVTRTQYDGIYGRVKALTYPNNSLTLAYEYNSRGYLTKTKNANSNYVYQEIKSLDARNQLTQALLINGLLTEDRGYDEASGQMNYVTAFTSGGLQRHRIDYEIYDDFGNLKRQKVENTVGGVNKTSYENYTYDNLHRLTASDQTYDGVFLGAINYNYDAVGNITLKSDYASAYSYGSINKTASNGFAGPNAVRSVAGITEQFVYDLNGNMKSGDGKTLSYNAFNKPTSIKRNSIQSAFSYGADLMRFKQVKSGVSGGNETTVYVGKLFEKFTKGSRIDYKYYLGDFAVLSDSTGGSNPDQKIGFIHRDRLGSVVTITDENGVVVDNKSYDPFGKPRKGTFEGVAPAKLGDVSWTSGFINAADDSLLLTNRGFTDHEHLDDAELIHMNGRVYDYNLGRFLSVDPFIQALGNSQSLNPYSYIMNNPLAGSDPSGYAAKCETGNCGSPASTPDDKGHTVVIYSHGGMTVDGIRYTVYGYFGEIPSNGVGELSAGRFSSNGEAIDGIGGQASGSNSQGEDSSGESADSEALYAAATGGTGENGELSLGLTGAEVASIAIELAASMVPFGEAGLLAAKGDYWGALSSGLMEGGAWVLGAVTFGLATYAYKAYRYVKIVRRAKRIKKIREARKAVTKSRLNHPVNISTAGKSADEVASIQEYVVRSNKWLAESGAQTIQSTAGTLRRQASAAARKERLRAARNGQGYTGQAGHVPDTAVTGQATPPGGWLDMSGCSNNACGGVLGSRIGQKIDHFTIDGVKP